MIHKCEYCDTTNINPCSRPCPDIKDPGHVCCTCDVSPDSCELPELVVCSGAICNFKFEQEVWTRRIADLESQYTEKLDKLKALNNHGRILGVGPNSLELMLRDSELDIPGIFLNKSEAFTWDQMSPNDVVTVGLTFMQNYEKLAKQWASWLNEKGIKVQIKKDQIEKSAKAIKASEDLRSKKASEITKANEPKARVSLNDYEKLVLKNMKSLKLTQEQSETWVKSLGMAGEARDLKSLGLV